MLKYDKLQHASQRLTPGAFRELAVSIYRNTATRQSLKEWLRIVGVHEEMHSMDSSLGQSISTAAQAAIYNYFDDLDLVPVLGSRRIRNIVDAGKGGWSNIMEVVTVPDKNDDAYLYIARDEEKARLARDSDEAYNHKQLAECLGIPDCCAQFFELAWPVASRFQGDLSTYSCAMTSTDSYPWDWRCNVIAQYFDLAPISFFPCSFNCRAASHAGQEAVSALSMIDPRLASQLENSARGCFLYTEYEGIHRWSHYQVLKNRVRLFGAPESTSDDSGFINAILIEYSDPHTLTIVYDDGSRSLGGADVALCLF